MHGASWQNKQREPSSSALEGGSGGLMSAKFLSSCSSGSLGVLCDIRPISLLAYRAEGCFPKRRVSGHDFSTVFASLHPCLRQAGCTPLVHPPRCLPGRL